MSLYVGDHLVCRFGRNRPNLHTRRSPHRVTYTRYRIDTIESPDDEHMAVRNMYTIEIKIHKEEMCVKLFI